MNHKSFQFLKSVGERYDKITNLNQNSFSGFVLHQIDYTVGQGIDRK